MNSIIKDLDKSIHHLNECIQKTNDADRITIYTQAICNLKTVKDMEIMDAEKRTVILKGIFTDEQKAVFNDPNRETKFINRKTK